MTRSRTMIAGGDNDGNAIIFKWDTWEVLHTLKGHEKRVACLEFIDEDTRVVTASNDTNIKIWTLTKNCDPTTLSKHKNWIKAMMISRDQQFIFTISEDYKLISWRIPPQKTGIRLTCHTSNIYNTIYSYKRNTFYTNANDKKVVEWDPYHQKYNHVLENDSGIYAMCMTYDEKYLIACSAEKVMTFWNIDSKEPKQTNYFNDVVIKAILATADGQYIITGDNAFRVTVREYRDIENGGDCPVKYIFRRQTKTVWSLAVTSNSSILFSGSEDASIVLYNLDDGTYIATLTNHDKKIKTLSVSRDNRVLISGSWDSTFCI